MVSKLEKAGKKEKKTGKARHIHGAKEICLKIIIQRTLCLANI